VRDSVAEVTKAQSLAALQHRIRVLLPKEKQIRVRSREQALCHLRKHAKELGFLQFFNLHRCVLLMLPLSCLKHLF
jgi:hypothetical protein